MCYRDRSSLYQWTTLLSDLGWSTVALRSVDFVSHTLGKRRGVGVACNSYHTYMSNCKTPTQGLICLLSICALQQDITTSEPVQNAMEGGHWVRLAAQVRIRSTEGPEPATSPPSDHEVSNGVSYVSLHVH